MRTFRRALLYIATGGILAAVAAWLLFPHWAPWLLRQQLPTGWRLVELDVGRPGMGGLELPLLTARGELGAATLELEVRGAHIGYPGLTVEARLVRLSQATPDGGALDAPGLDRFSIPRLAPPQGIPHVQVARLEIFLSSESASPLVIERLQLAGSASMTELAAELEQAPGLNVPTRLRLALAAGRLDAELSFASARDASPIVHFRQSTPATAWLSIDAPLEWVDRAVLEPWIEAAGLGALQSLSGDLAAELRFGGNEALHPERVVIALQQAAATLARGRLELSGRIEGDIGGQTVAFRIDGMAASASGDLATWQAMVHERLASAGIHALAPGPPTQWTLETLAPVQGRIALQAPYALEFTGDLRGAIGNRATADTGSGVVLKLTDLAWNSKAVSSWNTAAVRANVQGDLVLDEPVVLHLADTRITAMPVDASVKLAIDRPLDGVTSLAGQIERLEAGRLGLELDSMRVTAESLQSSGQVRLGANGLGFNGPLRTRKLTVMANAEGEADAMMTAEAVAFELRATQAEALVLGGEGEINGMLIARPDVSIERLAVSLQSLSLPPGSGRLRLTSSGLRPVIDGVRRTGLDIDLNGELNDLQSLAGSAELLLGATHSLPFDYTADLATGSVHLRVEQPDWPVAALAAAAKPAGVTMPEGLAFQDGVLSLSADLTVKDGTPSGSLVIGSDGMALRWGESRAEGLALHADLDLAEALTGQGDMALDRFELAAGLVLEALASGLVVLDENTVQLQGLRAGLLGGQLEVAELRLVNGAPRDTLVRGRGLGLEHLLKLLDVDGLDGNGRIDTDLPLRAEPDGLAVRGGTFSAQGPGRLSYRTGTPAVNIGLQALENFEYDSFSGTLEYLGTGDYTIAIDLLGRNPDLYGGHPIRFRLTLNGLLPSLFRSLFITGDFERAIIEHLNSGTAEFTEPDTP